MVYFSLNKIQIDLPTERKFGDLSVSLGIIKTRINMQTEERKIIDVYFDLLEGLTKARDQYQNPEEFLQAAEELVKIQQARIFLRDSDNEH